MLSRTDQTTTRVGGHETYRIAVPDLEPGMVIVLPGKYRHDGPSARRQPVRSIDRYKVLGRAYYRINARDTYGSDSFADVLATPELAARFGRVSERQPCIARPTTDRCALCRAEQQPGDTRWPAHDEPAGS